tara:strand:- start:368 stop:652 length:285 start_codon:yes stop_codon:yes gene_type:complete
MKTYYNGPKGMRYGGSTRKPMMYGGMPKKRKKKMMGGMNTGMSAPMPMNNMMNRQKMAKGDKAELAAMYGNPNEITRGDIITAAKKNNKKTKTA